MGGGGVASHMALYEPQFLRRTSQVDFCQGFGTVTLISIIRERKENRYDDDDDEREREDSNSKTLQGL